MRWPRSRYRAHIPWLRHGVEIRYRSGTIERVEMGGIGFEVGEAGFGLWDHGAGMRDVCG